MSYSVYFSGFTDIAFMAIDPLEKYKMMSMLYRYNSKFIQVLTDFIHPIFSIEGNGYLPLNREMDRMIIRKTEMTNQQAIVDNQKIYFVNKLIDELDSVIIVFVASPLWYGSDDNAYQPIIEICSR